MALLHVSGSIYAQDWRNSPATIALSNKLGLEKISECTVGISITTTTYESMKNSPDQAARDTYNGLQEVAISYVILGERYGGEQYRAEIKRAARDIKDIPDVVVIRTTAKNCFNDEIFKYTRNRGAN